MSDFFKIFMLGTGMGVFSLLVLRSFYKCFESGVVNLRFGNLVNITDNPQLFWAAISIKLCLGLWLFYWSVKMFGLLSESDEE